jgi:hypothetical protein
VGMIAKVKMLRIQEIFNIQIRKSTSSSFTMLSVGICISQLRCIAHNASVERRIQLSLYLRIECIIL